LEDKIFIVCGYGTIGIKVCQNLQQNNKSCIIVIDKNPLVVDKIFKDGFLGVQGDASSTRVLLDSSIKSANALICTFADDDLNALCIVSAKWLNPEIYIISRANKLQSVKKFKLAGASKVINFPNLKNKFLKLTNNRFKIDLLVSSLSSFESQFYISEIKSSDYSFLHSKQLLEIKNIADIKIMALKKINEEVISNPSIYEYIDKKDTIVILSEKEMN
jgi:voltage-gated potassium channel